MKDQNFVISLRTIITFFIIILGGVLIWLIKDVIITIFLALILALTIEPSVEWLRKRGVPHTISVVGVVLSVLTLVLGLASVAFTPLAQDLSRLVSTLPGYLDAIVTLPGLEEYARDIGNAIFSQVTGVFTNLVSATIGVFTGVLSAIFVIVFMVYVLLDFDNLRNSFIRIFSESKRVEIRGLVDRVETNLGGWLRGQLLLMVIVGVSTYFGLLILGVDYPLALAVIAGLLEIIPYVGPITAVIPPAIVGFGMSPIMGFGVIGLYILIQQLENHLFFPKIMQKTTGFNPIIVIIALMVGGKLFGLIGTILAIPSTIIITEILRYYFPKSDR